MKNKKSDKSVTYFQKKPKKVGKFFVLFVFVCFFGSIIFISSALSNFLSIKNWGVFVNSVSVPAINLFCVACGEYETETAATVQSELIKDKGGAGYIYKNNQTYTVLLFGYLDKTTANNVIENNISKLENLFLLQISIPKTKIQHNKSAKDVSALTNICEISLNTFKQLQSISNSFDKGELTSNQTFNKLFNLSYEIDKVIKSFEKQSMLVNSETYNFLLANAKNIFSKVNNLILNTSKQYLSCSIKYVALDVLFIGVSWHFCY